MATIIITVDAAGGGQFTTWQAAVDSIPKNIVASGNTYILRGKKGTEFTGAAPIILITGFITDATHNIEIDCGVGQSYRDSVDIATGRLDYIASRGVSIFATSGSGAVIKSTAAYTKITGLQVGSTNLQISCISLEGGNSTANYNLVSAYPATNGAAIAANVLGGNTFVGNKVLARRGGTNGISSIGDITAINNLIVCPSDGISANIGIYRLGTTGVATIQNNGVYKFATPISISGGTQVISHNATDAATSPASSTDSLVSLVYADQFTNTTAATLDLRTKSTSAMVNAGLLTEYTESTARINRPSGAGVDIGAWEVSAPATSVQLLGANIFYFGEASTLVLTKDGTLSGTNTYTPSDNGGGGSFNPTSATWTEGGTPPTFNYTTGTAGPKNITITNTGTLSNGIALSIPATPRPPIGAITSQTLPDGQKISGTFSTQYSPTNVTVKTVSTSGIETQGTYVLSSGSGTFEILGIPPGTHELVVNVSNDGGTNLVSGATTFTINGISGEPEASGDAPDEPPVVVEPIPARSATFSWTNAVDTISLSIKTVIQPGYTLSKFRSVKVYKEYRIKNINI